MARVRRSYAKHQNRRNLGPDLRPKFPPALRGVLGFKSVTLGGHFVRNGGWRALGFQVDWLKFQGSRSSMRFLG